MAATSSEHVGMTANPAAKAARRDGPLRVLLVSISAERGGMREKTLRILSTLGEQVEVRALCLQPTDLLAERGVREVRRGTGLILQVAPKPKLFRNEARKARELDRWIDGFEPDLVYADGLGAMPILTHLRPRNTPLLVHEHALPRAKGLPPVPCGQELAWHAWRGPKYHLMRPYELTHFTQPPQSWLDAVAALVPWWQPVFGEHAVKPTEQEFDIEEAFGHPYGRIGWRVPAEPLTQFDWQGAGVQRKYAIFFTGRSGSSWLASLLKGLGRFGNPQEYFNPSAAEYIDTLFVGSNNAREYLEGITRDYTTAGCFGVEMTVDHLIQIGPFMDVMKLFDPGSTQFVLLNRRNLLAQAFSFKGAIESGKWHSFTDGTEQTAAGSKIPLADYEVFWIIRSLVKQEQWLASLLESHSAHPLRLSYEDMVADIHLCLHNLTAFLGAEAPGPVSEIAAVEAETRKRVRPEVVAARLEFRARYPYLLDEIRRRRELLTVEELDAIFGRHGLEVRDATPETMLA